MDIQYKPHQSKYDVLNKLYYQRFNWDIPEGIAETGVPQWNLEYPITRNWDHCSNRLLFIIEHVPSKDLGRKKLFSNEGTGRDDFPWIDAFNNIISNSFEHLESWSHLGAPQANPNDWAFAFVSAYWFRTYDLGERMELVEPAAIARLDHVIATLEPTHIHAMGKTPANLLGIDLQRPGSVFASEEVEGLAPNMDISCSHSLTMLENVKEQRELVSWANTCGFTSECIAKLMCGVGNYPFSVAKIKPKPIVIDTLDAFDELMDKLYAADAFAMDTETKNLSVTQNGVLTIQFALDETEGYVIPLKHMDSFWFAEELKYIYETLAHFFSRRFDDVGYWERPVMIGQNLIFDMHVVCQEFGIHLMHYIIYDTRVAEFLIDENTRELVYFGIKEPLGLSSLFSRYDNHYYKDAAFGKDERKVIDRTPLVETLDYCAMDVQSVFGLFHAQRDRASCMQCEKGNWLEYFDRLVMGVYSDTLYCISKMIEKGSRVDTDYLSDQLNPSTSKVEAEYQKILADLNRTPGVQALNEKYHTKKSVAGKGDNLLDDIGEDFEDDIIVDVMSTRKHQQGLFFDVLGLEGIESESSKKKRRDARAARKPEPEPEYSVDKEFKNRYSQEGSNEYIEEVFLFKQAQEYENVKKFLSQYWEKIIQDDGQFDSRLRASYDYLILTGRSSSKRPSLQQVPEHKSWAKIIKRGFISGADTLKVKMDEATFEMRVWAMVSNDANLSLQFQKVEQYLLDFIMDPTEERWKTFKLNDIHRRNSATFNKLSIEEITDHLRYIAKAIGFGVIYGKGVGTLSKETGIPYAEMDKIVKQFFGQFPDAKRWLDEQPRLGREKLHVCNMFQMRRNLHGYMLNHGTISTFLDKRAMNSPIQGYASQVNFVSSRMILEEADRYYADAMQYEWDEQDQKIRLVMPEFHMQAMVHDSVECEVPTVDIDHFIPVMHEAGTKGVAAHIAENYGIETDTPLQVDFEIGDTGDKMESWNFTQDKLEEIIGIALDNKAERLGLEKEYA